MKKYGYLSIGVFLCLMAETLFAAVPDVPAIQVRAYINGTLNIAVANVGVTSYEVEVKTAHATDEAFTALGGTLRKYDHDQNAIHQYIWACKTNFFDSVDLRIRARNDEGASAWSETMTFEPHYPVFGVCVSSWQGNAPLAFDGYCDSFSDVKQGWVGLDAGRLVTVKAFRVLPRYKFGARMKLGTFQYAMRGDFSDAVTVVTCPSETLDMTRVTDFVLPDPISARYFRFVSDERAEYFSAAEIEFEQNGLEMTAPILESAAFSDVTNQYAQLTWRFPAASYCASGIVQRALSAGGPYTDLTPGGLSTDVTAYSDTNVSVGVRYYYRIRGICTIPGLETSGKTSDEVQFVRGRRIDRDWDNPTELRDGISILPARGYTRPESAVYPWDGNTDTFSDIATNSYIGLDLGGDYMILGGRFYPRSDNYCYARLNGVTLWGSSDDTLLPASALHTVSGVVISNWYTFASEETTNMFRYVFLHHLDPNNKWYGNVAEVELLGYSKAESDANYGQSLVAPDSVLIKRKADGALQLQWNAGRQAASYKIQRKVHLYPADKWETQAVLNAETRDYTDSAVEIGQSYDYRVVAVNGTDEAFSSTMTCSSYVAGSGTGLLGAYTYPYLLTSYDASETILQTRVDPVVNFRWNESDSLIDGTNAQNNVKISWTGKLIVPLSGAYIFSVEADDACALRIDGRFVINKWVANNGARLTHCSTNLLTAGLHDIRLDYVQVSGIKNCVLKWGGVIFPEEVIPSAQLIPAESFSENIGAWNCRTFNQKELGIHTNQVDGSITVSGWGGDPNPAGNYTYVWQEVSGSFDFSAKITSLSTDTSAKGFLMAKSRLTGGNFFAPFLMANGSWGAKGGANGSSGDYFPWSDHMGKSNPSWLRLCRKGTRLTVLARNTSEDPWETLTTIEDSTDLFGRKLYLGLAVSNPTAAGSAADSVYVFSDIQLTPIKGMLIELR